MSIFGYFSKYRPPLSMRRSEGIDPITGIRCEGDVLTGKLGAEEAIRRAAWRAARPAEPIPSSQGDPDPVLRHHLRLDKP